MLIGTGLSTGVVGLTVVIFFMLIPLKIEHIISNLQNRFFATSENAVDKETSNMLSDYVKKSVLPALTSCKGTSIDKSCNPAFGPSTNPVDALYNGWTQARLENKLASNYGIEFRYNKVNHRYYMKVPGVTSSAGDDITNFVNPHNPAEFDKNLFQQVSRGQVRTAVSDAMQNETKWKQVMYRYKVGRLLEEKYGITRCLIFCGTRDALADKVADQKVAAKLYLVQNVLTPRTQVLGVVIECLLDPSCDPEHNQPTVAQDTTNSASGSTGGSTTTADGTATITTGTEEAGAPKDKFFDAKVLQQFAASRGVSATEDQLAKAWQDVSDNGYQKIIVQEVFAKIGLGDLAGQAVDNASVIQWVNQAANLTLDAKKAGPAITKLSYTTNASADVKMFSMYRTYADEIHTGHVTATEVGSMVDSLGPVANSSTTKDLVGGTASAEQSPLYNNLITKTSTATGSHNYTCANGKSPGTDLICPEEKLGGSNAASGISSALGTPPLSYITDIASAWHSVVGGIFSFVGNIFGSIIGSIPGVSNLTDFISNAATPFIDFLTNKLVPNPFSSNMSGARTVDLVAEGADVAGNDFAHTGLGGKAVSAATAGQIANAEANQAQQDFSHQSFFARMFSTDSPYSLVSRIAMDMPINLQASVQTGFATLLSNPFGALTHGLAAIFSGRASANTTFISGVVDGKDVAGVTQYVPDTPDHPGDYWSANCSDNASQAYQKDNSWNQQAASTTNPDTGQPENTTANPCLAIKTTVCSAGATADSSLCTPDDLGDVSGNSTTITPSAAGGFTNPFPGGWTPNRLDMGYDGTFKGQIVAPFDGTVTYAGPFQGWNGSSGVIIKADNDVGLPTRSLYFTEGVAPITSLQGHHVTAGTPIANATASPYGDSYGQGANGAIEWGVSKDGPVGSQVDTEAVAIGTCGASAKSMVLAFAQWAQQKLGVAAPSTTDHAGCP